MAPAVILSALALGMPMFGGSLVTCGGLVFIGATRERAFRAIGIVDGREPWRVSLPAGGQANPVTYRSPRTGRQYMLIAAGGHIMLQSPLGDQIIAYALPGGSAYFASRKAFHDTSTRRQSCNHHRRCIRHRRGHVALVRGRGGKGDRR